MVLSSVVLPTPLRPRTAVISPDRHVEIDAVQHVTAAVEAVDLGELEHQLIALDPR